MLPAKSERAKPALGHFRRKTVLSLIRAWREVKGTARSITGDVHPSVPKEDLPRLHEQMRECLASKGGELSARAQTAELGRTYLHLNETGKLRFLKLLASEFDIDHASVAVTASQYTAATRFNDRQSALAQLRKNIVAPRNKILRQFTALPNGFKFLVDMRADLLPSIGNDEELKGLENDLKEILSSWFDIALLDLVQITWNSPAAVLEKLMEYEAVHSIRDWDDLKNRLDSDRRIYAFFHNKMPMEPLIFVQVAFTQGMSDNIQHLLDESAPSLPVEDADTATFYSISNAQKGLAGISFGNFLIKRVVNELSQNFKHLKTVATLSPIPSLCAWLDRAELSNEDRELLTKMKGDWHQDTALANTLKPALLRLCAHYLTEEKQNGKPRDPVANFHLFNGARLERINWLADVSPKGMQQSAGMMVNYHYKLSEIDENHEAFVREGKIVAARSVRGYL